MAKRTSGARRALCVGINNYPGTGSDLSGCVNDARDWKSALQKRGYTVRLMLDSAVTRAHLVTALRELIAPARSGDSVVFTYSGHGTWVPDSDIDEPDGRDEALCPYDIMSGRYLLDDDLAELFALKQAGVRVYFVSDSCHSGTVTRFMPLAMGRGQRGLARPRFLPPEVFLKGRHREHARRVALAMRSTRQKYPALLAAACGDAEYSYDASFNGRPNGAFTYFALRALKQGPRTPTAWMRLIRKNLPAAQYPQTPRLYGSQAAKGGAML